MELTKQTVEAKSRKLNARWTVEEWTPRDKPKWLPNDKWRNLPSNFPICPATIYEYAKQAYKEWFNNCGYNDNSQHGIDVEAEILAALSAEIVVEIDKEVIEEQLARENMIDKYKNQIEELQREELKDNKNE